MNPRSDEEVHEGPISRQAVEKAVSQLVMIARSEEACRLLGVDGVLVNQVNITILDEPLDYVAHDIVAALRDAAAGKEPVQASMLSSLVAELRLCGLLTSRIDQHDLVERVVRQMREL